MTTEILPLYKGKLEDFVYVGFGSGSGTNLRECASLIKPRLIFSDRPTAKLLQLPELSGIEKLVLNGYEHCGSWKKAKGNPTEEMMYRCKSEGFNELIVDRLHAFEEQIQSPIHLIVLGGYMRLVMRALLEAYQDRIINVHPSLLAQKDDGTRAYTGEDAVYDAIKAGELYTRSSVIMVDSGVDHGEILTQGPMVKVSDEFLMLPKDEQALKLREYADQHQNRQKEISDWVALKAALFYIATGRLALCKEKVFNNEWRQVHLDGQPLPYEGIQVGEKK